MGIHDIQTTFDTTKERPVDSSTDTQLGVPSPSEAAAAESRVDSITLSKNVIFDILKNQRRRWVLDYLRQHETSTLSDLAEHVAALEHDTDVQSLTSSERKRVYVGLYQCHLPRMNDARVIDYDQARGIIELRESTAQVIPYLDLDPRGSTSGTGTGWGRSRALLGSLSSLLNR